MACGTLTLDQLKNCDFPLQAGTRDKAKILNLADIATITRNATTKAIEAFTNTTPGSAVVIDGQRNSIAPKYTKVQQGVFSMYDHEVSMMGFDISPEVKDDLEQGADGQYVVVVENFFKGQDGNAAFEIYGLDNGLELTDLERDVNNQDTQGAFSMRFYSDVNKEPRMPATLWDTDYATTKAIFDAL